jgi:exodeoxyribonuclease VII large subunit
MDIKYVTISDLNRYIKAKFDTDIHLQRVYLKGEISNFKRHTRGHLYFTLKDENSRINAVMFASSVGSLKFSPEDGMKVLVSGRITVYEANGGYQIYVDTMEQDGLGNLYIEYEKLKKKLADEGLFDPKHKRALPRYPQKIGIITAPTGAAIRDILSTIKRRYPLCSTILFPALVQGTGAKESIVQALTAAQDYDLDLIICGRGGGSIEDLWAFNEECVAQAIYASKIPIISAVGHEIDFTIADYVADLRAPTPTGAAEMAVPSISDINIYLNQLKLRCNEKITNIIKTKTTTLNSIKESYILKNPLTLYEIKEQKLDNLIDTLNKYMLNYLNITKTKYLHIISNNILKNPLALYEIKEQKLDNLIDTLNKYMLNYLNITKTKYLHIVLNNILKKPTLLLENKEHDYQLLINKLELLNPLNILKKGYSVVTKNNQVIKDIKELQLKDKIKIKLSVGEISAEVIGKEKR